MDIIYKVVQLYRRSQVEQLSNVVFNVHWSATATQTDQNGIQYTATVVHSSPVELNSQSNFLPFDSLTEEIVLSWIMPNIDTTEIQESLQQELNAQINPPVLAGLPW